MGYMNMWYIYSVNYRNNSYFHNLSTYFEAYGL